MKRVYLAGPFFDDEQIDRIERLEKALTENQTVSDFLVHVQKYMMSLNLDLQNGLKQFIKVIRIIWIQLK